MHSAQGPAETQRTPSQPMAHAVGSAIFEPCSSVNKQDISPTPHPGAAAASSAIPTAQSQWPWGSLGTGVPLPMVASTSDHSDHHRRTPTATATQPDYCLTGQADLAVAATTRAQAKQQAAPEAQTGGSHSCPLGETEPPPAPSQLGGGADMEQEPSLLPNEAIAASSWRHALSLMYHSSLPSIVQQLATEAMALTAAA